MFTQINSSKTRDVIKFKKMPSPMDKYRQFRLSVALRRDERRALRSIANIDDIPLYDSVGATNLHSSVKSKLHKYKKMQMQKNVFINQKKEITKLQLIGHGNME